MLCSVQHFLVWYCIIVLYYIAFFSKYIINIGLFTEKCLSKHAKKQQSNSFSTHIRDLCFLYSFFLLFDTFTLFFILLSPSVSVWSLSLDLLWCVQALHRHALTNFQHLVPSRQLHTHTHKHSHAHSVYIDTNTRIPNALHVHPAQMKACILCSKECGCDIINISRHSRFKSSTE